MRNEIWLEIPEYEGFYLVSNFGRVRSMNRKAIGRNYRAHILKAGTTKSGYKVVALTKPGQKPKTFNVHTLVLLAFVGAPCGLECRHLNGRRSDNRLSNLKYGTRSENALDRHKHGTLPDNHGEKAYWAKLNRSKVAWIRKNAGRVSFRAMGRQFGVHHCTISAVVQKQSWW